MRPLAALRHYVAAEDPRVEMANVIAMVLAWNTPFYPLYLLGAAGAAMQPGAWFTLAVFPVFLAIPAITRRSPFAGRVLLAGAGLVNTVWCTWLLGEESGTQLFLLACIALVPIIFRQGERFAFLGFLALPIVWALASHGRYPASPFACQGAACESLVWLNAFSVSCLSAFLALMTGKLLATGEPAVSQPAHAAASMRLRQPRVR